MAIPGFDCVTQMSEGYEFESLVLLDLDALPERDVAGDLLGGGLGGGVIPGCVAIGFSFDHDVVVARGAFPRAHGVRLRFAQIGVIDALGRKVDVPLHDSHVLGRRIGDSCAAPCCFRHEAILDQPRRTVSRWRLTRNSPEATITPMPASAQPSGKLPNTKKPSAIAQMRPE